MITVHLHGVLEKFGGPYTLDARDPAECVNALSVQLDDFRQTIADGNWHVVRGSEIDGEGLTEEQLQVGMSEGDLHIMPAVEGAGGDGLFQTIAGIALITASFFSGPLQPFLFNAGVAMTMGGVSQMLTSTPDATYEDRERPDQQPSFLFDGAVNTSTQGIAVPVGYGRMRVGSVVISAGLRVEEMDMDED